MHTPLQNYMNIGAAVFLSFPETAVDPGTVFEAVRTIACDPFSQPSNYPGSKTQVFESECNN